MSDVTSKQTSRIGQKSQNQRGKPWSSYKLRVNLVKSGSILSLSAFTRNTSGMPVLAMGHTASQSSPTLTDALFSKIVSLEALSMMAYSVSCRVCLFKSHKTLQSTFIRENERSSFTRFRDANFKQLSTSSVHKKLIGSRRLLL